MEYDIMLCNNSKQRGQVKNLGLDTFLMEPGVAAKKRNDKVNVVSEFALFHLGHECTASSNGCIAPTNRCFMAVKVQRGLYSHLIVKLLPCLCSHQLYHTDIEADDCQL